MTMTITPEQFNKLALKEDLSEVKQDVKEVKENMRKVMGTLEVMNKTLTKIDTELAANTSAHDRFQTTINNHEVRITKIEKMKVAV